MEVNRMQSIIRSIETPNSTYIISYKKISKTTYEQREEQKERLIYFIIQKSAGLLLISICIIMALIAKDSEFTGLALVMSLLIGLPLITVNKRILSI